MSNKTKKEMLEDGSGKQGESPVAAERNCAVCLIQNGRRCKKIEPSEKAVAGLTEKVPVIYFLSGQGKGGQHIYILIVECV